MIVKICSRCKCELPATKEYFRVNRMGKHGLQSQCRKCRQAIANEHKEREAARKRKWYDEHVELCKNRAKQHYEKNKEHHLQLAKQYRANPQNKERLRYMSLMGAHRRIARKKKLPADFTKEQWKNCLEYFGYKCAYCGASDYIQQDHFIPVAKGGGFTANNIVPACMRCNVSKNDSDFMEWYSKQPFYSEIRIKIINNYFSQLNTKEDMKHVTKTA